MRRGRDDGEDNGMRVDVNGVGIDFDVAGEGRPVLLLHGFPDCGRLWRNQVPDLVDAGFRVIVPDLRGYGRSDQPDDVESYAIPFLAGDVLGILDQLGIEKSHVVGHDWGAALAWVVAAIVPDRVDHLVALSVGHPVSFRTAGLAQNEKSWYMLLFQFPGVAEQWLSNDGWANFRADLVAAQAPS
jgi:pimeloyl-ACP methyl ester carboxylesterase